MGSFMWKLALLLIVLGFAKAPEQAVGLDDEQEWHKTRAIKEVPFCAFILRDFLDDNRESRELAVLMEPDQVTEGNLTLLFKALSEKHPKPTDLRIQVYTDVEQLGFLATGLLEDKAPPEKKKAASSDQGDKGSKREPQFAFYKRTKYEEYFSYYVFKQKSEVKTVILRSKR